MPSAEFNTAAEEVQKLAKTPGNDDLLKLYGLFKQATVGNVNTDRPGAFDFKGKAKWDAWKALEGKPQEEAEKEYIALVESLKASQ